MSAAQQLDLGPPPKPYALTPQYNDSLCQFCGQPEERDRPFVAILTNFKWAARHWVHHGECHEGHSARCRADREDRARAKSNITTVQKGASS